MNILLMNGSPRSMGNTNTILTFIQDKLISNSRSEKNQVSMLSLVQKNIQSCHGCRACFQNKEDLCPCKDELNKIKGQMKEADIIVIGSPVYVEDVSGLFENFIDRLAYCSHRPFLNGKPVYLFTTSGAGASKHAIQTMKHALISWGACVIASDNYTMGPKMEMKTAEEMYEKQINKRVDELLHQSFQSGMSLYALMAFQVQKKFWLQKQNDSHLLYDYRYWSEQGWLKKECMYYHPVKVGVLKKAMAGLLGKFVGMILYTK